MKKAAKLIVKGNVQKVGFREYAKGLAKKYTIAGSVENLAEDEGVLILCEGNPKDLSAFISGVNVVDFPIAVEEVIVEYVKPTSTSASFIVKRGLEPKEFHESLETGMKYIRGLYQLNKAMLDKQDKTLEKQDKTLDKQDKTLGVLTEFKDGNKKSFDEMIGKQDQMLGKQDQMLGKQDQMLGKQDKMIGTQDKTLGVLTEFKDGNKKSFDEMIGKQDQMLGKQDQMIGKQDKTLNVLIDFKDGTKGGFNELGAKYHRISKTLEDIRDNTKR